MSNKVSALSSWTKKDILEELEEWLDFMQRCEPEKYEAQYHDPQGHMDALRKMHKSDLAEKFLIGNGKVHYSIKKGFWQKVCLNVWEVVNYFTDGSLEREE